MVNFIKEHANDNVQTLALQRKRYSNLSDTEFLFALQQIEGRQKTKDKLPTIFQIENWLYPVKLSLEQCSSEITAKYKANLVHGNHLADLTGGFGIDCFFMSDNFSQADYIEQNADLCDIATHNFAITNKPILVHNSSAETFLDTTQNHFSTIFIDPARRSKTGGKVFKIEDCEPNIVNLLPLMKEKADQIMVKLSPMLDISSAIKTLSPNEVHIVAVDDEVKELLLIITHVRVKEPHIFTVNLTKNNQQSFAFTPSQEAQANADFVHLLEHGYLCEPNSALLKAGAFKLIAEHYNLQKLAANTHLYYSKHIISDFPGRIFQITDIPIKEIKAASIITRNYPMTPEQLRKKLKLKEHDKTFLIATSTTNKKILLVAERIY